MEYMHNIKKAVCKGLEPFAEKGKIEDPREIDMIWKIVDIIKNVGKIEMMDGEGYAEERGSSYAYSERRRRDSMGRYSSDGYGDSYRGEEYSRYSRAEAKDHIMKKLGELMEGADQKEREALKEAMRTIEKA